MTRPGRCAVAHFGQHCGVSSHDLEPERRTGTRTALPQLEDQPLVTLGHDQDVLVELGVVGGAVEHGQHGLLGQSGGTVAAATGHPGVGEGQGLAVDLDRGPAAVAAREQPRQPVVGDVERRPRRCGAAVVTSYLRRSWRLPSRSGRGRPARSSPAPLVSSIVTSPSVRVSVEPSDVAVTPLGEQLRQPLVLLGKIRRAADQRGARVRRTRRASRRYARTRRTWCCTRPRPTSCRPGSQVDRGALGEVVALHGGRGVRRAVQVGGRHRRCRRSGRGGVRGGIRLVAESPPSVGARRRAARPRAAAAAAAPSRRIRTRPASRMIGQVMQWPPPRPRPSSAPTIVITSTPALRSRVLVRVLRS